MKFWERLPTYEESTRSAMGKRTKQLQSAQLPADLLEPLLSKDLSMNEKHDLIEEAPDAVFDKTDGTYGTATLNLENQLVNAKYDELAQRVACRFHLRNASANLDWCKELVELDINRRWVIQRKEWLEGKITTIETSVKSKMRLQTSQIHKINAYKKQTQSLIPSYWDIQRKQWSSSDSIKSVSASRALKRQRKHPDWYLSGVLREDCAQRGGCCGRGCGCCERSRIKDTNTYGVTDRGHCTTACSCCLEAHGVDGEDLEMKDVNEVHFQTYDNHTLRLLKGYVFYLNGME